MTRTPRALLFDLDDTLVEEEPARDAALLATAARTGRPDVDPAALATAVRSVARALWWAHPLHEFAHGIGVASWEALWARFEGQSPELAELRAWAPTFRRETWHRALRSLGIGDPGLAADLAERFPEERRAIHRAYPDVPAGLRALREDGRFRLGVLTNGLSCLQREKLRGAGLEPWFGAVVAGGDVGSRKPDPAVFDALLDRLGAGRRDALMIGNNPETDILGAREAGIEAILIVRDDLPVRDVPDAVANVTRIRDLRELVARLGVAGATAVSDRAVRRPPRA